MELKDLKKSRTDEYEKIAETRYFLLKSLDELNEFSSKDHYKVSVLNLVKREGGKTTLARILLVHPDRALANKVRSELEEEKVLKSEKDGATTIIKLTDKTPESKAA